MIQCVSREDSSHTVVSDEKTTFKSKALDTDDKFSYRFQKPGTYSYFCSNRPEENSKNRCAMTRGDHVTGAIPAPTIL
jgi:plastocyanin